MCLCRHLPEVLFTACILLSPAPEGKRSSGLTAVWVARNRFAVLDRMHSVRGALRSSLTTFRIVWISGRGAEVKLTSSLEVLGFWQGTVREKGL